MSRTRPRRNKPTRWRAPTIRVWIIFAVWAVGTALLYTAIRWLFPHPSAAQGIVFGLLALLLLAWLYLRHRGDP